VRECATAARLVRAQPPRYRQIAIVKRFERKSSQAARIG
jgi:hypothetical protein